jgi:hypothetical protein
MKFDRFPHSGMAVIAARYIPHHAACVLPDGLAGVLELCLAPSHEDDLRSLAREALTGAKAYARAAAADEDYFAAKTHQLFPFD